MLESWEFGDLKMGSWARTLPLNLKIHWWSLNLYFKYFHILSSLSNAFEDHDFHKMCFEVFIHVFLSCVHDYLELHDGSTLNAGLISRLCGNTLPSTQHSTGSSMLLRFRTDTSVTHKGFKAKYSIGRQITVTQTIWRWFSKSSNWFLNLNWNYGIVGPGPPNKKLI